MYRKIEGMVPSLPIPLRIKTGGMGKLIKTKGDKMMRLPEQWGHFKITKTDRDEKTGNFIVDGEAMAAIGTRPQSLNVRLLYDDPWLNLTCRYLCWHEYEGCKDPVYCEGNKKEASRLQDDGTRLIIDCDPETCDVFQGKVKSKVCKLDARLTVQLTDLPDRPGVCAQFKTTSEQAASSFLGTMKSILMQTGGIVAGIPLKLIIIPKQRSKIDPVTGATKMLRANYIVGLEQAQSIDGLLLEAGKISQRRLTSGAPQKLIEAAAAKAPVELGDEKEFYDNPDGNVGMTDDEGDAIESKVTGETFTGPTELYEKLKWLAPQSKLKDYWEQKKGRFLNAAHINAEVGKLKNDPEGMLEAYDQLNAWITDREEAGGESPVKGDTPPSPPVETAGNGEHTSNVTPSKRVDEMIVRINAMENYPALKSWIAKHHVEINNPKKPDKDRLNVAIREKKKTFDGDKQEGMFE